jgi:hypothetical protein
MLRKRSLSEVHDLQIFDGPTVILRGHPSRGIPRDSQIRIATAEGQFVVEDTATKEFAFTGDPGRYVYSIRKHYPRTKRGLRYVAEFLIGMTVKQWEAMEYMEPSFSHVRQTTKGPRWKCGALGCGNTAISKISAMEHEASHRGKSFLEAVDAKALEQELQDATGEIPMEPSVPQLSTRDRQEIAEMNKAPEVVRRRAGRPRKNPKGDWTNVPGIEET